MKRTILIIIAILLSAVITFVFFEAMSWYHFGDTPTKTVLIRLIGFFLALSGISIGTIALITKNKKQS